MVDPIDKYAVRQLKEFVLKTFADKRLGDGSLPLLLLSLGEGADSSFGSLCPSGWPMSQRLEPAGAEIL